MTDLGWSRYRCVPKIASRETKKPKTQNLLGASIVPKQTYYNCTYRARICEQKNRILTMQNLRSAVCSLQRPVCKRHFSGESSNEMPFDDLFFVFFWCSAVCDLLSPAQPSRAQPSSAQTSSAEHTPAQQSTAQRCSSSACQGQPC